MFEVLVVIAFLWLLFKAFGLVFKIAWGAAKIVASFLMVFAMPLLVVLMIFVGGMALLIPIAMIAIAVGILRACV